MQSTRNRIAQLEGLRIIAILMIFLSHMEFIYASGTVYPYSEFYLLHLHNPDLGVDYFFMLSGFGMYLASLKAANVRISLRENGSFALRRIRKIYPFYLVSMALMLPFQLGIMVDGVYYPEALRTTLTYLPFSLTLTQTLFGVKYVSRQLNNVCWFLSSLTIVYFFSPVLLSFFRRRIRNLKQAVIALLLTFAAHLVVFLLFHLIERNGIFDIHSFNDLSYGSPYNRVFYVALGMEIAVLYTFLSDRYRISTAGEILTALIVLLYYAEKRMIPENTISEFLLVRILDIVAAMLLLGVFSLGHGKLSAGLSRIKKASKYVIYIFLFHYPMRFYVDWLFSILPTDLGVMKPIVMILVILGITILIAAACEKLQNARTRGRSPQA